MRQIGEHKSWPRFVGLVDGASDFTVIWLQADGAEKLGGQIGHIVIADCRYARLSSQACGRLCAPIIGGRGKCGVRYWIGIWNKRRLAAGRRGRTARSDCGVAAGLAR